MVDNLRYALENESNLPQDAAYNIWVLQERKEVLDAVYEQGDDPRRGPVQILPFRTMHPGYFKRYDR